MWKFCTQLIKSGFQQETILGSKAPHLLTKKNINNLQPHWHQHFVHDHEFLRCIRCSWGGNVIQVYGRGQQCLRGKFEFRVGNPNLCMKYWFYNTYVATHLLDVCMHHFRYIPYILKFTKFPWKYLKISSLLLHAFYTTQLTDEITSIEANTLTTNSTASYNAL